MEVFDAILSTEVLAGILIIGAFAISVRSTLHFSRGAADMRPRLAEVERELRRLRESTGTKRERVTALAAEVAPVKDQEAKIRAYGDRLRELSIELERKEQEKDHEEAGDRRRRIQRKKMGFDSR